MEFNADPEKAYYYDGLKFIPISTLVIPLGGSRKFVVSKRSQDGKLVSEMLNSGVKRLIDEGFIRQSYIESGFLQ